MQFEKKHARVSFLTMNIARMEVFAKRVKNDAITDYNNIQLIGLGYLAI